MKKPSAAPKAGTRRKPEDRVGHALTVSRPALLKGGSDRDFRRLVHNLFGFLARHEAIREGHGAFIGLAGIEYTTLIAIAHLSEEGDVSVRTLAEHLHLSGAFVTTVTNRLLARGLIDKAVDPADRRRVCLTVKPPGRALLEELAPVQRQVNDVEFGDLASEEFRQLSDLIEKLLDSSERALSLQRYLTSQAPAAVVPVRKRAQKPG